MKIKITTFALVKDYSDNFLLEIENYHNVTLGMVIEKIITEKPVLKKIINDVAFAVNQEYCNDEKQQINDQDEIALIPPVSGG